MAIFTIEITSPIDRDALVAEICTDNEQLAELRREGDALRLEIYGKPGGTPWDVPFEALVEALSAARTRLESFDELREPER